MAKDIKSGEEKYHDPTVLGTLAGIFTFSNSVSDAVDSNFGDEKTRYYIEEDGKKEYFSDSASRDAEVLKRVHGK